MLSFLQRTVRIISRKAWLICCPVSSLSTRNQRLIAMFWNKDKHSNCQKKKIMSQFHFIQIGLLVFAFVNVTCACTSFLGEIEVRRDDVKALNNFKFKLSYIFCIWLNHTKTSRTGVWNSKHFTWRFSKLSGLLFPPRCLWFLVQSLKMDWLKSVWPHPVTLKKIKQLELILFHCLNTIYTRKRRFTGSWNKNKKRIRLRPKMVLMNVCSYDKFS